MKVRYLSAMCVVCQLTLMTSLLSAAPPQTNSSSSSTAASSANSQSAKHMTQLATKLLQQVTDAKQAISNNNKQAALKDVNQALADRNQLASVAKANGYNLVVPLYTEFDESSTLAPLISARKGNQNSKPKNALNSYTPITVDQVSGEYTFIGLDLDKAKTRLEAAKTALNNGNNQAASDSLDAIGTDLVMETDQMSLPLLAARENLNIAESAVKNGHNKEAAAALKEASTDLNKYVDANANSQHAEDAKNLSKTIDAYSNTLSQSHAGSAAKIDGWWHQVDNWFNHPSKS